MSQVFRLYSLYCAFGTEVECYPGLDVDWKRVLSKRIQDMEDGRVVPKLTILEKAAIRASEAIFT